MAVTSYQLKKSPYSLPIGILCFGLVLSACTSGYYTSKVNGEKKVYRVDEQGNKVLVYEMDHTGRITVHDADDPMVTQEHEARQMVQRLQAKKNGQLAILKTLPKRRPEDPIYVSLALPVLDTKMQRAERSKGAVAQQIREEFLSDPIIQLMPARSMSSIADVEVSPKVFLKEVYGRNRVTGKPGKMVSVVYEAIITSQVPPASYTVSESGHLLQNVEVSKRFAERVRQVILEKIGPDLPAN